VRLPRMKREYETNEMERNKRNSKNFRLFRSISFVSYSLFTLFSLAAAADSLPGAYFHLLEAGVDKLERRMSEDPGADLKALEARPGWRHFPYTILAPTVLYIKRHPQNTRYRDPKLLALALRIGDLLASENEKGVYEPRLDSDWDTYMWLEAYRLLESELGADRRGRWKRNIEENIQRLVSDASERLDFPWYHSPSPGYNYLTLTGIALYWEHSKDDAVMPALRRAKDFHMRYTFLDGTPVDVINDRNRHWGVSAWGQFAFTHFPDGRSYAAFLTSFFRSETLTADQLGRLAQDALYCHEGPREEIPQAMPRYSHQMSIPAGIRKTGPWQVALSGLMSTQAINSQFYLDRQGHISVFHQKLGLIITGANSKRQPELATFSETLLGQTVHMPISTRLQMSESQDRLSLAYNTFFTDLHIPAPSETELTLSFAITGRGRPAEDPRLNLQLCLKAGETLETGAGRKITLGSERIELAPAELGGWIRHHGWKMKIDPTARLIWPVYPHNPYTNAPEVSLERAVGALTVPLRLAPRPGHYIRTGEQEIVFTITIN
jgi:hypothetical protein